MSDNSPGRYAEFKLNRSRFALPVSVILDLGRFEGIATSKIPGSPEMIDRVINHRGRVIPVVDLRRVCGFVPLEVEVHEMEMMLKAREQDHVNWLTALAKAVDEGSEFTLARDPHMCKFGKWYDDIMSSDEKRVEITNRNVALEAVLREYDLPHGRIHALADRVLDLAAAGGRDVAKREVKEAWEGDLSVMRRLFARTMVLFREVRQPQLVVMELDGVAAGLMVDEILSVVEYAASDIHPIPDDARTEAPVSGLAGSASDNEMVSFLDPAGIFAAVAEEPGHPAAA